MKKQQLLSKELIQILTKATDGKIYGSVEIYFEQGQITQITQRIISKIQKPKAEPIRRYDSQRKQPPSHFSSKKLDKTDLPSTPRLA